MASQCHVTGLPTTVRLHSLVCVGTDYPHTPPSLAVMVESNGHRETHNIQTKVTEEYMTFSARCDNDCGNWLQHMEAEVNLHFPRSLKGDKKGKYLLCNQLRRLQVGMMNLAVPQMGRTHGYPVTSVTYPVLVMLFQECFDIYVEHKTLSEEHKPSTLYQTRYAHMVVCQLNTVSHECSVLPYRGRGRLLSFFRC